MQYTFVVPCVWESKQTCGMPQVYYISRSIGRKRGLESCNYRLKIYMFKDLNKQVSNICNHKILKQAIFIISNLKFLVLQNSNMNKIHKLGPSELPPAEETTLLFCLKMERHDFDQQEVWLRTISRFLSKTQAPSIDPIRPYICPTMIILPLHVLGKTHTMVQRSQEYLDTKSEKTCFMDIYVKLSPQGHNRNTFPTTWSMFSVTSAANIVILSENYNCLKWCEANKSVSYTGLLVDLPFTHIVEIRVKI